LFTTPDDCNSMIVKVSGNERPETFFARRNKQGTKSRDIGDN
jgi:hypothetical protein